jgi:hypothetical protein
LDACGQGSFSIQAGKSPVISPDSPVIFGFIRFSSLFYSRLKRGFFLWPNISVRRMDEENRSNALPGNSHG